MKHKSKVAVKKKLLLKPPQLIFRMIFLAQSNISSLLSISFTAARHSRTLGYCSGPRRKVSLPSEVSFARNLDLRRATGSFTLHSRPIPQCILFVSCPLPPLGKMVKNWKRRWFVLKDDVLYYFENTTDPQPKVFSIIFFFEAQFWMLWSG
jgi:hypothetical protein